MKRQIVLLSIMLFLTNNFIKADSTYITPTYSLTATNLSFINANTFEFDIYLRHTNPQTTVMLYGACQYYLKYDTLFKNGGTMIVSLVSSDLATNLRPNAANPFRDQIRLAANLPSSPNTTDTVKWTTPGTKVATIRLSNTVPFNTGVDIALKWRNMGYGNPYTKITVFTGLENNNLIQIQDSTNHMIGNLWIPELVSPSLNSINNPININFIWKKVNSVFPYRLQVASDPLFANIIYNDSTIIDSFKTVNGFLYNTSYFWRVGSKDSTGITHYSPGWNFKTIPVPSIKINLTLLMEGKYYPLFNLLSRKDSVTAYLRKITSPYNLKDSAKGIIDSLSFTGLFPFYNSPTDSYYVIAKHNQCIETWSKAGGQYYVNDGTTLYNYNFTTSISQAYGNNMIIKGTKSCLFSGELDNNGIIDVGDIITVFNDQTQLVTGNVKTDINGDNIVDSGDLIITYNNMKNSISVVNP